MNHLLEVSIEKGKYTVIQDANGKVYALRHGEEWRDLVGDNLVLCLAQNLEETRAKMGTLAGGLLFVIEGLRRGTVKSKPILDTSDKDAKEFPTITLEQHLWKALHAIGVKEIEPIQS